MDKVTLGMKNELLSKMHELAMQAKGMPVSTTEKSANSQQISAFSKVLAEKIRDVNQSQVIADRLQEKFVLGDTDITLPQVIIAAEKASIQTQFMLETRNKIISAYNEIMNMAV